MPDSGSSRWHLEQVTKFNQSRASYQELAGTLESVLRRIRDSTDPTAIVQVRAKSLASFSEKALRKKNKYGDPVQELTDLVGGRVITYTQTAADAVCRMIADLDGKSLVIDWDNSVDTASRLKPEEFGYKAMHFIVQLKPPKVMGVDVPNRMSPFKAEIQVCTMMQHVWAAISHDRVYKTRLTINDSLKRRLSAISALIETAQGEFESGIAAIDRYRQRFFPYMDADSRQEEELKWKSVIEVEPYEYDARWKLGEYFAALGRWEEADEQFSRCPDSMPGVLAKRARAAERLGRTQQAMELFEQAAEKDGIDWAVRCDWAELLARQGRHEEALQRYREAFEIAPGEPRVLSAYVTAVVCYAGQFSCTAALRGALDAAIEENQRRVELNVDLPNALLHTGRCCLFRGDLYASLDAYCKASLACESLELMEAERSTISAMLARMESEPRSAGGERAAFKAVEKLLGLLTVVVSRRLHNVGVGGAAISPAEAELLEKSEENRRLESLATQADQPTFGRRPVVIVAGGCDQKVEERMKSYRATIDGAFATFDGTIICGGTKAGISGLMGEVAKKRGEAIEAIGYLPPVDEMPEADRRDDENYRICEVASGTPGYTPIGPIQTWADLLLAGVEPTEVRLLGINGGDLSGFEFRLAMAAGATVGLIEDSGRAVSTLLTDPAWRRLGRLAALFNEVETIAPFVSIFCPGFQAIEDPDERRQKLDQMAHAQHEEYRNKRLTDKDYVHPSILPWDQGLDASYKDSNRQQAAYADKILRTEGFAIVLVDDPRPAVDLSEPQHAEALARMARREHGRFNAERLADGWQYGPARDVANKTSPFLVPWLKLPEYVKDWDRAPFRRLPAILQRLGLKIVQLR